MTAWLDLTALDLARLQFAFVVSAHILFPAFTIGLASYLAVLNGLSLVTGDETYRRLFDYWKTVFAVVFGMGVVSGLVMSYQFGTNWAVFSERAGPVIGPLMGYEVLTAFFLEAGFLGIMLLGRNRVGPGLHFAATCIVAFGTLLSAFWILAANSWMQTPAGFAVDADGRFLPVDWWAIVFNPSMPYRVVHMVLAAYLTTAFLVGGVGGWHLLRDRADPLARRMLSMAYGMILVVAPMQILAGDLHGLNTLEHQPAKLAAIEGHWENQSGNVPLILFGLPDDAAGTTSYRLEVPYGDSLILDHSLDGSLRGLSDFPADERPPMQVVFWTFRAMVGLGFAMLGMALWSAVLRWRGRLDRSSAFHRAAVLMAPSGLVAVLAGWITTEVGRQPWTVYGLLRTDQSMSVLSAETVGASLMAFVVVYFVLFGAGTVYVLRLFLHGPSRPETEAVTARDPVGAAILGKDAGGAP
ncbi:MAG: cytochrome ubiquinol oxidase subunit I [Rhodobacteraceae bacterium]|nr:cytochrome ubiquinol oxidase subunit I [Paracoccaceae bacterium]